MTPKEIAANIRTAIERLDGEELCGYMAGAMLEDLAQQWENYDSSVEPKTILSDVEDACTLAREMAKLALALSIKEQP